MAIIVILGGAGFYAGWVQFAVPPGSYGLVNSRTHGMDPHLLRPGEFRWLWYRLIPTNVQITVFSLETVQHSIHLVNTLPSAATYAAFAGIDADFSWELGADFSFRLDADAVAGLASGIFGRASSGAASGDEASGGYNFGSQDAINAYARELAQRIEIFILRQWFLDTDEQRLEEIMLGGMDIEIERAVASQFPQIRDFSFFVRNVRFPDFAMYRQVRYLFNDFIAAQREFISTALAEQAQAHISTQLRLGELEQYGQLLERYPALLQFLAMEMGVQLVPAP